MQVIETSVLQQALIKKDGSVEVCRTVTLSSDTGSELSCTNTYTTYQAGERMPDDVYKLIQAAASH